MTSRRTSEVIAVLILVAFLLLGSPVVSPHLGIVLSTLKTHEFGALVQTGNAIGGHVLNTSRRPIAHIYVILQDDFYREVARTRTDESGRYVFNNISQGNYVIEVQASDTNYLSESVRVTIQNFTRNTPGVGKRTSGNEFVQQDFILRTANDKGSTSRLASSEVVFVQEIPDEARRLYNEAVDRIRDGKMSEGLAALREAIQIFPRYHAALDRLGTELVKSQQYETAIPVLLKAVEVNARGYSSWYALGLAQYNLKQLTSATESLRRCVGLNPRSPNCRLWLGIVLRQAGKFEEAETHLKRANELALGKASEAHWQLALLYNQLKRYGDAADELEQFLKVAPDARDAEMIKKLIKNLREKASKNR